MIFVYRKPKDLEIIFKNNGRKHLSIGCEVGGSNEFISESNLHKSFGKSQNKIEQYEIEQLRSGIKLSWKKVNIKTKVCSFQNTGDISGLKSICFDGPFL